MFHDLKLNLEQDEQSYDMNENVLYFYESIQDKLMMDNQELKFSPVVHQVMLHLLKEPKIIFVFHYQFS